MYFLYNPKRCVTRSVKAYLIDSSVTLNRQILINGFDQSAYCHKKKNYALASFQ